MSKHRRAPEVVTDNADVVARVVAHLRAEADTWNDRLASIRGVGGPGERERYREVHETLRRVANEIAAWMPKAPRKGRTLASQGTLGVASEPALERRDVDEPERLTRLLECANAQADLFAERVKVTEDRYEVALNAQDAALTQDINVARAEVRALRATSEQLVTEAHEARTQRDDAYRETARWRATTIAAQDGDLATRRTLEGEHERRMAGREALKAAERRLALAPLAEARRLCSEDYCGAPVLGFPGVPCGRPKGHDADPCSMAAIHKPAADLLACVAIDLADAIDAVLPGIRAALLPREGA